VALAERFGWIHLDGSYGVLGSWWAIALIAVLLAVEVVAVRRWPRRPRRHEV
jgi:uncharacterized membrane protein